MNYLIRLHITHKESSLEVLDADTGEVLAARTIENLPEASLYAQRNRLFEALSSLIEMRRCRIRITKAISALVYPANREPNQ